MKILYTLLSVVLLSISPLYAASDIDFSSYVYKTSLEKKNITIPKIVEIEGGAQGFFVVVESDSKRQAHTETRVKENILLPKKVEACFFQKCTQAPELLDGTVKTYYDFSLVQVGENAGSVRVEYERPIKTRAVYFSPTSDSYMPDSFSLYADGKLILQSVKTGETHFPEIIGTSFEIVFSYTKPIRFGEVGVGYTTENSKIIRFVYEPGKTYDLYEGGAREGIKIADYFYGDLFDKTKKEELIRKSLVAKNPSYTANDSDKDGISDERDNCKMVKNPDQQDSDNNGVGNECDDYDFDGVIGFKDNCPHKANYDQKDSDRDGLGDACDAEESRPTEKYKWLEWVVLAGGVILLGFLFYKVKNTNFDKR